MDVTPQLFIELHRCEFGMCALDGRLWVAGGCEETESNAATATCESYDAAADRWVAAPALRYARAGLALVGAL